MSVPSHASMVMSAHEVQTWELVSLREDGWSDKRLGNADGCRQGSVCTGAHAPVPSEADDVLSRRNLGHADQVFNGGILSHEALTEGYSTARKTNPACQARPLRGRM